MTQLRRIPDFQHNEIAPDATSACIGATRRLIDAAEPVVCGGLPVRHAPCLVHLLFKDYHKMRKIVFAAAATIGALSLAACSEATKDSAEQTAEAAADDAAAAAGEAAEGAADAATAAGDAAEGAAAAAGDAAEGAAAAASGAAEGAADSAADAAASAEKAAE